MKKTLILIISAVLPMFAACTKSADPEKAAIVITHYQRLLDYIVPDIVHVLKDGKIVKTAGRELVAEIEEKGYDNL